MTPVRVVWAPDAERSAALRSVPVLIRAGRDHRVEVLVAPGEEADIPGGPVELYVEAPGYQPWRWTIVVGSGNEPTVVLDPGKLVADPLAEAVAVPHGLTAAVVPWTVRRRVAARDTAFVLAPVSGGLTVHRRRRVAGAPRAVGLQVASARMPRRLLAVPAVSPHDECRVVWRTAPGAGRRPRIEPVDGGGRLLMEYLLAGRHELAAVAARSVERIRGDEEPLNWVAPSYTQLLIGYAYAAGHDRLRLARWCARTAARTELGADGLILAAEVEWWSHRPAEARALLARAAVLPPPSILFGGEIAVRLASRLAIQRGRTLPEDAEADVRVLRLSNDYLRLLSQADGGAANLSVAATGNASLDLTGTPLLHRLPWLLRYALSRLAHPKTFILGQSTEERAVIDYQYHESADMTGGTTSTQDALRVGWPTIAAFVAPVLALAAGLGVAVRTGQPAADSGPLWLLIGALGSFAFLAVGAGATALALRGRAARAEREADRARRLARHYQQDAMRGRALMAVLLAEQPERSDGAVAAAKPDPDAVERHVRIARRLYGVGDEPGPDQLPG